ncbi:hypothetical protein V8E55_003436 [Tylopilus felleus]
MFKLAAKIRDRAQIPHESQYGSASSWTHMIQKFFFSCLWFLGELAFKLSFSPWARPKKRPRAGVPNEKNVSRSPQRKMGGSMRTCFISITPGSFLESCRRTTRGETAPTSLPSTRARNASMVSICDSSTYRRARRGPRRPNQQRRHCDFAGGVRHGSTSRVSSTPIAVASMMGQLATTQQWRGIATRSKTVKCPGAEMWWHADLERDVRSQLDGTKCVMKVCLFRQDHSMPRARAQF